MLDVHVPHKTDHTWTDFFIHIATIIIGLIIAIGLEQTVEAVHHLHQRHQLEHNLRDELRVDLRRDAEDFRVFSQIRAYTVELKSAVSVRRTGAASPPAPPSASDTRRHQLPSSPRPYRRPVQTRRTQSIILAPKASGSPRRAIHGYPSGAAGRLPGVG